MADVVNVSSVAGRTARAGSGVYNVTKFGVVALTESMRQEFTRRHVRVSVVEPGAVATNWSPMSAPPSSRGCAPSSATTEPLQSEDIAEAIAFTVTRPRRMAINELLIRPTEQER